MAQVKNAAMGVIRSGPIPNPGRYVPQERENNPKEILGIFVNPREDAAKPKKARNGMKRKKARSLKRRTTKKRVMSAPKKRRSSTRRRKTTARRAARTSNPRRKKRRVAKKLRVAKRRTAARRAAPRRKRRSNPIAPGYVARAANPSKKRTKKRKSSGKMTVAKMRNLLRSIARRKNPSTRLLTGRTGGAGSATRGISLGGAMGVSELKGRGLLDASSRLMDLAAQEEILLEQIAEVGKDDPRLSAELQVQLANVLRQKADIGGGMGLLDAAILSAEGGTLKTLRDDLLGSATKRKREAAKRAALSSRFRGADRQRLEYYAAVLVKTFYPEIMEDDNSKFFPKLRSDEYTMFNVETGARQGKSSSSGIAGVTRLDANSVNGQATLLMMPPEAVALAISILQDNYMPMGESKALERADAARAISRLQALLGGRIENPRRSRRKGRKGSVKRKGRRRKGRRAKNPRKSRRSAKAGRRKSRKGRKGRRRSTRRRNPGGMALLSKLSSPVLQTRLMAAGQVALAATAGYVSVGLGEKFLELVGLPPSKLTGVLGSASNAATAHTILSALVSGGIALAAGGWSKPHDNPISQAIWEHQIPALVGIGARAAQGVVDALVRGTSTPEKLLRSSVGLAPSVSGYGSWSPDMGAYYNFQPVMGSRPAVGYQVAMAGAPKVGYQLSGSVKPGYTVNGYANYAPAMSGYANYAPAMSGRSANPWGSPF